MDYNYLMQSETLREYTSLENSGMLEQLQHYQMKAHDYEELLSQSLELFTKTNEEDLTSYLVSCLIQRFIPGYLVVFLCTRAEPSEVHSICYQNLRPAPCPVALDSIEDFREFFDRHPATARSADLTGNAPELASRLSPLNPEILIPLNGIDGLYGFVVLGRKVLDDDYTADEHTYIEILFEYASISLQNVIHYNSSVTDFKTRLYNHAFFLRRMQEEMSRVGRYNSSFALLAIDIDHFKSLNDRHGHLAGDRALHLLSRILEDSVRSEDIVSRYGGEEFLILLSQCSKSLAWCVAERIRNRIADAVFSYQQTELRLTVSIGVTHCSFPPEEDHKALIDQADRALYQAKNNGRNRCEVLSPGLLLKANRLTP